MDTLTKFSESAKSMSRNPLGIIALFIVLIYGFASLVVVASNQLTPEERYPIIWFLVLFPLVVLAVFSWLVSKHHHKLYAPKDYSNDEFFLNISDALSTTKDEVDDLDIKIERGIISVVTSEEFVQKLNEANGGVREILYDIAEKVSKEVKSTAFIEVDAREFAGDRDKIFSLPVSAFRNFDQLLDRVFFRLPRTIKPFTYGHSWVLVDIETNEVIKSVGMIKGTEIGKRVDDYRALSDLGIGGGSRLKVVRPNAHNK
ncbi:MAG TPA: hypothetical protein ENJ80_05470 [Gammaproteobacteria bacterium]|nr:hypothetical protein [Gammaproteobacteria bacterium]